MSPAPARERQKKPTRQKATTRKRATGRPQKAVDAKVVEGMYYAGATTEEVAAFCEVSRDTIERRFLSVREKARARRKLRLRQLQWRRAEAGSDTMLVWLGKQELGQTDRSRIDVRDVSALSDAELAAEAKALGLG